MFGEGVGQGPGSDQKVYAPTVLGQWETGAGTRVLGATLLPAAAWVCLLA